MSVYLDASALVPLFLHDSMTDRVRSALRARLDLVTVSDWTLAEAASVISRAVRTRVLEQRAAQQTLLAIDAWVVRAADRIEIVSADIKEAELIIRRLDTSLRAPDALHLVVAKRAGLPLLSFDAAMVRDAASLGVDVVN